MQEAKLIQEMLPSQWVGMQTFKGNWSK